MLTTVKFIQMLGKEQKKTQSYHNITHNETWIMLDEIIRANEKKNYMYNWICISIEWWKRLGLREKRLYRAE